MHDMLFSHQDALQLSDLTRYAADLGLDVGRFEQDLRTSKFTGRVGHDVNTAEEAGVAGTPTFFINEVLYRGARDRAGLEQALARIVTLTEGREIDRERREAD